MDIREAAHIIDESEQITVLTGAGISTPSGIPDFRSDGGVWDTVDPEIVASVNGLHNHPDAFWDFYDTNWRSLTTYQPNPAHAVVAKWEAEGRVGGVITQNIDGLHEAAGTTHIANVHGTTRTAHCLSSSCPSYTDGVHHGVIAWDELQPRVRGEAQACPLCGDVVKPSIILFGEDLPTDAWNRAMGYLTMSDLVIVVGSSLIVDPVGSMPAWFVRNGGGQVIMLNRDATEYDEYATGLLRDDCADTLVAIDAALADISSVV